MSWVIKKREIFMSNEKLFTKRIKGLWSNQVKNRFMFRGMIRSDLNESLKPDIDPFSEVRSELMLVY